ncbi:apolipoprotein D [Phymastichus coffea]|uniref:apolipoprotein D n=1 Tax=Phymastichus coffea TaxID=108790 RepID=UPI00273B512F|nr:apolipoprotein D [Phymastichus coffea]
MHREARWGALSFTALLFGLATSSGAPSTGDGSWRSRAGVEDRTRCPRVKAIRNLDIGQLLGAWYVVQYYASSEEALSYQCMRAELSVQPDNAEVTMNFTYSFVDDPMNEQLFGNITWKIPEAEAPAHWLHAEVPYEGIYNTYVLDSDYKSWALLMHCAEKAKSPRYLSSLIMSRQPSLPNNVVNYLREKLPRYGIDLEYMFPMHQTDCQTLDPFVAKPTASPIDNRDHRFQRRHPLKRKHKRTQQQI